MMPVEIVVEDDRWQKIAIEALCSKAFETTLVTIGLAPARFNVEILACDDKKITELNHEFRGKATPTNVLSWPSVERGAFKDGEMPRRPTEGNEPDLGDIAIAYETSTREASQLGKPHAEHVLHLIVHATLHLLGYDHQRDQDATLMERTEVMVLGKLGVGDPYSL